MSNGPFPRPVRNSNIQAHDVARSYQSGLHPPPAIVIQPAHMNANFVAPSTASSYFNNAALLPNAIYNDVAAATLSPLFHSSQRLSFGVPLNVAQQQEAHRHVVVSNAAAAVVASTGSHSSSQPPARKSSTSVSSQAKPFQLLKSIKKADSPLISNVTRKQSSLSQSPTIRLSLGEAQRNIFSSTTTVSTSTSISSYSVAMESQVAHHPTPQLQQMAKMSYQHILNNSQKREGNLLHSQGNPNKDGQQMIPTLLKINNAGGTNTNKTLSVVRTVGKASSSNRASSSSNRSTVANFQSTIHERSSPIPPNSEFMYQSVYEASSVTNSPQQMQACETITSSPATFYRTFSDSLAEPNDYYVPISETEVTISGSPMSNSEHNMQSNSDDPFMINLTDWEQRYFDTNSARNSGQDQVHASDYTITELQQPVKQQQQQGNVPINYESGISVQGGAGDGTGKSGAKKRKRSKPNLNATSRTPPEQAQAGLPQLATMRAGGVSYQFTGKTFPPGTTVACNIPKKRAVLANVGISSEELEEFLKPPTGSVISFVGGRQSGGESGQQQSHAVERDEMAERLAAMPKPFSRCALPIWPTPPEPSPADCANQMFIPARKVSICKKIRLDKFPPFYYTTTNIGEDDPRFFPFPKTAAERRFTDSDDSDYFKRNSSLSPLRRKKLVRKMMEMKMIAKDKESLKGKTVKESPKSGKKMQPSVQTPKKVGKGSEKKTSVKKKEATKVEISKEDDRKAAKVQVSKKKPKKTPKKKAASKRKARKIFSSESSDEDAIGIRAQKNISKSFGSMSVSRVTRSQTSKKSMESTVYRETPDGEEMESNSDSDVSWKPNQTKKKSVALPCEDEAAHSTTAPKGGNQQDAEKSNGSEDVKPVIVSVEDTKEDVEKPKLKKKKSSEKVGKEEGNAKIADVHAKDASSCANVIVNKVKEVAKEALGISREGVAKEVSGISRGVVKEVSGVSREIAKEVSGSSREIAKEVSGSSRRQSGIDPSSAGEGHCKIEPGRATEPTTANRGEKDKTPPGPVIPKKSWAATFDRSLMEQNLIAEAKVTPVIVTPQMNQEVIVRNQPKTGVIDCTPITTAAPPSIDLLPISRMVITRNFLFDMKCPSENDVDNFVDNKSEWLLIVEPRAREEEAFLEDLARYKPDYVIYMQAHFSQSLTGEFLKEVHSVPDDYFLPAIREIDALTNSYFSMISGLFAWNPALKEVVFTKPFVLVDQDVPLGSFRCANCLQKPCTENVKFFGNPYMKDINKKFGSEESTDNLEMKCAVCNLCKNMIFVFNRLVHQKYHMMAKCTRFMLKEKGSGRFETSKDVLTQLLEDSWGDKQFKMFRECLLRIWQCVQSSRGNMADDGTGV